MRVEKRDKHYTALIRLDTRQSKALGVPTSCVMWNSIGICRSTITGAVNCTGASSNAVVITCDTAARRVPPGLAASLTSTNSSSPVVRLVVSMYSWKHPLPVKVVRSVAAAADNAVVVPDVIAIAKPFRYRGLLVGGV